jgi:alpha-tubulin suppressor-like RCC1 family protein
MSTPVQLQEEAAVRQISGSFVLTVDGQVRRMSDSGHSAAVPELAGVVSIQHLDEMFGILFALKEDGTVWYLKRDSSKPVRLGNYTGIASIYSTSFSLFLQDDNAQLHYINGSYGELLKNEAFLVPVPAPHKISQFSAGFDDEALILTEDGTVFLFSGSEKVLKPVPAMSGVKRLAAAGQGLYLFAKDDGTVWGLGKNRSGMLGPDADQALEPVQLPGLKAVTEIVAGTDHVLALNQQGEIYSWGSNMTGQLGRLDPVWDQWTEIGQLADVRQAVALPDRPYFIREGGAVWTMEEDGQAYPVQGLTRIKDMELMIDVPVTLSDEGTVHLWPGQFAGCQSLSVPFAVKDMAVNNEQLLLLDQEGNMVMVFLQAHRKERAGRYETTSFILDKRSITVKGADAWAGRIKSLHANPYAFLALTEDGQVFYTEKTGDGSYVFKQVEDLPAIKQLAAEYYIIGTVDPVPIWALDKEGRVHEINLELMRSSNKITSIKDTVLPEVEQGTARISGRLRITESGEIYERGWEKLPRQAAKHPVRLVSSSYSYAIEGPGSHYHLLVTENDRIVMMGYNLFGGASSKPDKVLAR